MNKYKTFEELKEELGDKFEEYMYKANIELLTKIDKAIKLIEEIQKFPHTNINQHKDMKELKEILKGNNNEL